MITDKAKKWAQDVVVLHGLQVAPHLQARKDKLLKRAQLIKKTLEASDPLRPLEPVAQELGFIPLLIAGGVVAVAALAKWSKDAYQISVENDQFKTLVAQGVAPSKAKDVASGNASGFNWKYIAIPAALLAGGLITYKLARK